MLYSGVFNFLGTAASYPLFRLETKEERANDQASDGILTEVVSTVVTCLGALRAPTLEQNRKNAEMHTETGRNQYEFHMMMLKMMSIIDGKSSTSTVVACSNDSSTLFVGE